MQPSVAVSEFPEPDLSREQALVGAGWILALTSSTTAHARGASGSRLPSFYAERPGPNTRESTV
jgi:hypothetical protein